MERERGRGSEEGRWGRAHMWLGWCPRGGGPSSPQVQKVSSRMSFQKCFSNTGHSVHACVHAQYDWMTGVLDNGNEWRKFRAVPRLYPLRSLVCTLFNKGGIRGAFRLPGAGGDHFHCTVETFARSYSVSIKHSGTLCTRLWTLWILGLGRHRRHP